MNREFHPRAARRLSAVAVAAALLTLYGAAAAQSAAPTAPSGYLVDRSGDVVHGAFGQCIRQGIGAPTAPCPPAGAAQITAAAQPTAAPAAAGASSAAGASALPPAPQGYVQQGVGDNVVLSGFGECVRSGFWTPAMAAPPCDRVPVAQVAPPPVPVVQQAPEPKPEPAPIAAQPAPAPQPAPIVAAPPPPRMLIQKVTLSTDLLFAFDKAQLREEGKEKLDELAAQAKDARVEEVLAIGYADPIGRPAYNEKLSAERAAAVKDYLVQQGVPSERINVEGRGESRQFTDGRCDKLSGRKLIDCFEPNRRVEVELLGSRQVAAGEAPEAAGAAGTTGSPSAPAGAAGSAR